MAIPTRRCVRGEGSVRVGLGRVSLNSSPSPGPNPSPNPNPDQAADARDALSPLRRHAAPPNPSPNPKPNPYPNPNPDPEPRPQAPRCSAASRRASRPTPPRPARPSSRAPSPRPPRRPSAGWPTSSSRSPGAHPQSRTRPPASRDERTAERSELYRVCPRATYAARALCTVQSLCRKD